MARVDKLWGVGLGGGRDCELTDRAGHLDGSSDLDLRWRLRIAHESGRAATTGALSIANIRRIRQELNCV
jgi:hypothetical protein